MSFASCASVGGAILSLWFGIGYALAAFALAAVFVAVDFVHYRRGGRLAADRAPVTRRFLVREVGLTVAILVVGSAVGAWLLEEIGARLEPPVSLPGVLLALTSAGAASYAAIAWLNRRQ